MKYMISHRNYKLLKKPGFGIGSVFLLILTFVFLISISKVYLKPYKSPSHFTYFMNPSPFLEYFTFGYQDLVADLLWLRAIQDLDQCDRPVAKGEVCNHSWAFRMVNKVTDLSPRFRIIYATVPLILSLVVNDSEGAIQLLDKGLIYFPNDWRILYRGGYLYLFERGDKVKAADYFIRAQKNGGPDWLAAYATRLYSQAGRSELIQKVLSEYQEKGFSPELLKRMKERLEEATQK